jgi:hypothetical protein
VVRAAFTGHAMPSTKTVSPAPGRSAQSTTAIRGPTPRLPEAARSVRERGRIRERKARQKTRNYCRGFKAAVVITSSSALSPARKAASPRSAGR